MILLTVDNISRAEMAGLHRPEAWIKKNGGNGRRVKTRGNGGGEEREEEFWHI